MAIRDITHAPRDPKPSARTRTVRGTLNNRAFIALSTLLLLVVVKMATGLVLGHLLAAGIGDLLGMVVIDDAS